MNPLAPVTAIRPLIDRSTPCRDRARQLDWRVRKARGALMQSADSVARATWSSTFRRFQPGPMTVFGPLTLAVNDWAAPRRGQPQMFNHPFFEWFTGTRPRTLVLIFLPASAFLVWAGLVGGWSATESSYLFGGGVMLWTLIEFLMPRFVFNLTSRHRLGVLFAYLIHGVHHAFPEDRRRWLMPP